MLLEVLIELQHFVNFFISQFFLLSSVPVVRYLSVDDLFASQEILSKNDFDES